MAGILDLIQSEDPAIQNGLLNFGLSLLRSKGNFGNAVGQAGVAGQLGARDYRQQEALLKRTGLTDQLLQMQVQQAQQQAEQQRKLQDLAQQYSRSPQQQAMAQNGGPTVAAANAIPTTAPGFDYQGYANALAGINPMAALQVQQSLHKEQPKLSKLEVMRGNDGKMINVAVFDDGTSKVLPYGVKPEIALQSLGNRVVSIDKNAAQNGQSWTMGVSPDAQLSANTTMRGQNMTDARARDANTIAAQGQRTQIVIDPNFGPLAVDKGLGTYKPVVSATTGQPIPGENKVTSQKQYDQLTAAMGMARELLPVATGSGAGAMVDKTANFFGGATEGDKAASQLETLAGWMTANVPRMQGPQSDKDVAQYRIMAAQVGDRTKPVEVRLRALDTLETLQRKYAQANGVIPASQEPPKRPAGGDLVYDPATRTFK